MYTLYMPYYFVLCTVAWRGQMKFQPLLAMSWIPVIGRSRLGNEAAHSKERTNLPESESSKNRNKKSLKHGKEMERMHIEATWYFSDPPNQGSWGSRPLWQECNSSGQCDRRWSEDTWRILKNHEDKAQVGATSHAHHGPTRKTHC